MSEQAITGTPTRGPGRRVALNDRSPRRWSAPGRFFPRTEVSADLRTLHRSGGRQADDFYRDRCNHDKVVRSTHGVNCTGSCSWEVYVNLELPWHDQQPDLGDVGSDADRL